jgi:hypothetical protein
LVIMNVPSCAENESCNVVSTGQWSLTWNVFSLENQEERRRNEDTDLEGKHIIFYQITVDYTF